MRAVWVAVIAGLLGVAGRGAGQDSPPTMLPSVAPADESTLGGGTLVSRPLTPVEIPVPKPPEPPPTDPVQRVEEIQEQKYERRGPLGPDWDGMEFLLWWPKAHPLPPLVTASRSGVPPVLGNPATTLLV